MEGLEILLPEATRNFYVDGKENPRGSDNLNCYNFTWYKRYGVFYITVPHTLKNSISEEQIGNNCHLPLRHISR